MSKSSVEKLGAVPRKSSVPDYDHLFDENSTKSGRRAKGFLGKIFMMNKGTMALSSLIYVIQSAPLWISPIITANIINIVTGAFIDGTGFTQDVWRKLIINAVVLIVSLVQNIPTTVLRLKMVNKMLRRTSAGIKTSVVKKLQSLSITYHKEMQTGKIQSKFLKDTDSVELMLNRIMLSFIPNLISVIASIIISVYSNGWISLFFLMVIPLNVFFSLLFRDKIKKKNRNYRVSTENMSAKLTTMLDMIAVTKAHGLEDKEISTVQATIEENKGMGLSLDRTVAYFGSGLFVVNRVLSAINLFFCVFMAFKGYIAIGDIVLFSSMFTQISGYVTALVDMIPQLGSGKEAVRSVSELMNVKDVEVNSGKVIVPKVTGNIEFKNLSYKYPDKDNYVVKNFNLKVNKGECIAVVGASGSGKSTLMNLIIGLLKPTDGDLLIDGKSIKDLNLSEYRHHLSVVPQTSVLFSGSIRENIVYGLDKYSREDFDDAVKRANVLEFVDELPNGLDTRIGEHGDKLSGGQKQRITIARALIRNPSIFILDEATSALDNISEYHVQQAIESSIKGRTTFIVAHRLSTIRNADRIVVMEDGEIAETGTYEELMAKKGKFFELKNLNEINLQKAEQALA
ncbi:MAG: ABC transporter ATP-binding protein [Clostridia bacterium]|nr:ABC transporter ATP-binding protein [Clostridia bacterium]